jgi:hypothetical protein
MEIEHGGAMVRCRALISLACESLGFDLVYKMKWFRKK